MRYVPLEARSRTKGVLVTSDMVVLVGGGSSSGIDCSSAVAGGDEPLGL